MHDNFILKKKYFFSSILQKFSRLEKYSSWKFKTKEETIIKQNLLIKIFFIKKTAFKIQPFNLQTTFFKY
jgi:hypothetical protein